jgi:NADH-quinone oxidoreductase subunit N
MTVLAAAVKGPHIDFAGLSPLIALIGGACVVLLFGLAPGRGARTVGVPALTLITLAAFAGLTIWQFGERKSIISGALRVDDLALVLNLIFAVAAAAAVLLSWRAEAPEEAGHGEYHALLLSSAAGMAVLVGAQNLVTLFLGLELLSIPLYVLCATELRREHSLESGLKYLVIGSVGSATLLYGLALIYGATGDTDFTGIARALDNGAVAGDPLMLTGIGLLAVGLAFKASVAPFHQWTPDVYEGAPTPITAFMAVATKAAAFGVTLRIFDVALIDAQLDWAPLLAALAAITIVVGNVGALGQSSLKRLLAYSSVAQAGYLMIGVVVGTRLGLQATVYYLAVYLAMNLAAFAVIIARERETGLGDDISAVTGIGGTRPWLAWPMTIAMLSLAGIPATAGFVGKIYLIDAAVDGGYTWLGIVLVVGSMISLAYYLRVVAAMWMREAPRAQELAPRPAMAGGAPEAGNEDNPSAAERSLPEGSSAERSPPEGASYAAEGSLPEGAEPAPRGRSHPEVTAVAVVFGAASLVLGIIPSPLFRLARDAGSALGLF